MNYRFYVILIFISIILSCAKSNVIIQNFETEQIVHCSEINTIEDIINYVVYLNKGDIIPINMTLDSKILDIANDEIHLVLKQKVYFRLKLPEGLDSDNISSMSEEEKVKHLKQSMIYLSSDAIRWAPYSDIKAVEQVFGIKGGSFSFGMGITKEDGIKIFINVKTNSVDDS